MLGLYGLQTIAFYDLAWHYEDAVMDFKLFQETEYCKSIETRVFVQWLEALY